MRIGRAARVPKSYDANSRARRQRRRHMVLGLLAVGMALLVWLASLTAPFRLVELRSFDYLSTISPPARPQDGPVIVAIDEPSMNEVGQQWPWPRALHAELIAALRKAGARAIGVDVIFSEPAAVPENDDALAAALGKDVVLAGDETLIQTPQAQQFIRTEPLQAFTARGTATGIASVNLEGDGTMRRIPDYPDGFAAQLARIAGRQVHPHPPRSLLQSFGPARTYPTVSYYQALDPDHFLPENIFRGRVVIVGLSLQNAPTLQSGGTDAFATAHTIRSGQLVAGAEAQAAIFDNLVNDLAITRVEGRTIFAAIAAAAFLAVLIVLRSTSWFTAVISAPVLIVLCVASYIGVRYGRVFVSPVGPMLAYFAVAAGQTIFDYAAERRSRHDITRAFSQYLSPALVERLANDPSHLKLGGERRKLTILFCDVRGFTTISEALKDDPEALTTLINRLLTPLSDIVLESGGTIDKYIGDCLMAFWNAPLDAPDHASQAVGAALQMLSSMDGLNAELQREAEESGRTAHLLRIGIGINTGDCVVGNMGSLQRFDYSVLGDSVNLASRLEGESKNYGVPLLIGEETAERAAGAFTAIELARISVKGRAGVSAIHTVLPKPPSHELLAEHAAVLASAYDGSLSATDARLTRLEMSIPGLAGYYRVLRSRCSA